MWYKPEIVAVIFKQNSLFLSWLQQSKKDPLCLKVKGWEHLIFDVTVLNQSSIFNFALLQSYIRNFLKKHALTDIYCVCAFDSDLIWEDYYWYDQTNDLACDALQEGKKLRWNYRVIHTDYAEKKSLLYRYGLSRQFVFQMQLLALQVPFNCIYLSSLNNVFLDIILGHLGEMKYTVSIPLQHHCAKMIDTFGYRFVAEDPSFYDFFKHNDLLVYGALGLYSIGKSCE